MNWASIAGAIAKGMLGGRQLKNESMEKSINILLNLIKQKREKEESDENRKLKKMEVDADIAKLNAPKSTKEQVEDAYYSMALKDPNYLSKKMQKELHMGNSGGGRGPSSYDRRLTENEKKMAIYNDEVVKGQAEGLTPVQIANNIAIKTKDPNLGKSFLSLNPEPKGKTNSKKFVAPKIGTVEIIDSSGKDNATKKILPNVEDIKKVLTRGTEEQKQYVREAYPEAYDIEEELKRKANLVDPRELNN